MCAFALRIDRRPHCPGEIPRREFGANRLILSAAVAPGLEQHRLSILRSIILAALSYFDFFESRVLSPRVPVVSTPRVVLHRATVSTSDSWLRAIGLTVLRARSHAGNVMAVAGPLGPLACAIGVLPLLGCYSAVAASKSSERTVAPETSRDGFAVYEQTNL